MWELGEACGPLLIAPLSEIFGRYLIFNACNVVFIFAVVLAACSRSVSLFIFARFLTGVCVAGNVLNPCIIGDMFTPETRGKGMSLVMLAPLLGSAIGPAISGVIAESLGWRFVLWVAVGLAVMCEVLFLVALRETYKVTILKKRLRLLKAQRTIDDIGCDFEKDDGSKLFWKELRIGIGRPMYMLWDSTVLQIMAVYGMLEFTFYCMAESDLLFPISTDRS